MQAITNQQDQALQQIYQTIAQFSVEQQLNIAEHIKKHALACKWNQFSQTMPTPEADITEEEIIQEINAMRAKRGAE